MSEWPASLFDVEKRTEKVETLKGNWVPFGTFDKALDYFGDGSMWIIQAPGHMPGNLICAVKIKEGDWVILGSDCAHSR